MAPPPPPPQLRHPSATIDAGVRARMVELRRRQLAALVVADNGLGGGGGDSGSFAVVVGVVYLSLLVLSASAIGCVATNRTVDWSRIALPQLVESSRFRCEFEFGVPSRLQRTCPSHGHSSFSRA